MARNSSLDEFGVGGSADDASDEAGTAVDGTDTGDADTGAETAADGTDTAAGDAVPTTDERPPTESGTPAAAERDDADAATAQADGTDTDAGDAPRADGVDPAVATYRWDPDGLECAACGSSVDRVWRQDDDHVCADCKEW
jgi:hypothetical protein